MLAVACWAGFGFCVYLMFPAASQAEDRAAMSSGRLGAAVALALVCTGVAAIARAAGRGGIGWVALGVMAFLAVSATPLLLRAVNSAM